MPSRCGIDDKRGDLLSELTAGFEALLEKVEALTIKNDQYKCQILSYQKEGRQRYTPDEASSPNSDASKIGTALSDVENPFDDLRIDKGYQAWKLLRTSITGTLPLPKREPSNLSPHTVSETPKIEILESDFTTLGKQGNLKCPFSRKIPKQNDEEVTKSNQSLKPRSDFTSNVDRSQIATGSLLGTSTKSRSHRDSAPKCPIRFLNELPPEDVAEYFENHKHEIPRSHEVCVKRYQANEQSIRSLDEKYGSLVNMIQGLGAKHQPLLPSEDGSVEDDEAVELDRKSMEKVEKWAEGCNGDIVPVDEALETEHKSDSERTGHFERPLKEVRLGESPSRPWGIQVPFTQQPIVTSDFLDNHSIPAPVEPVPSKIDPVSPSQTPRPTGKCPFGHGGTKATPDLRDVANDIDEGVRTEPVPIVLPQSDQPNKPHDKAGRSDGEKGRPQLVFTGPVFFGYSAEDTAALMKSFQ